MAGVITEKKVEVPAATEAWNLLPHLRRMMNSATTVVPVADRAEADSIKDALTAAGMPPTSTSPLVVIRNDKNHIQEVYADGQWTGDTGWVQGTFREGWAGDVFQCRKVGIGVEVRIEFSRTGAGITVPANGNMGNVVIGDVPNGFQQGGPWNAGLHSASGGRLASGSVHSSREVQLASVAPGADIATGEGFTLHGFYYAV